jgi:spore coat polysaccharide biosynthesis protein SpsF (cytidylyltransferase family)
MKYKKVRMTVDEPSDFKVITILTERLGLNDTWKNYTNLYLNDPKIHVINNSILRNEGYLKSINKEIK